MKNDILNKYNPCNVIVINVDIFNLQNMYKIGICILQISYLQIPKWVYGLQFFCLQKKINVTNVTLILCGPKGSNTFYLKPQVKLPGYCIFLAIARDCIKKSLETFEIEFP